MLVESVKMDLRQFKASNTPDSGLQDKCWKLYIAPCTNISTFALSFFSGIRMDTRCCRANFLSVRILSYLPDNDLTQPI